MDAVSELRRDKGLIPHLLGRFAGAGARFARRGLSLLHESNEEIEHAIRKTGRMPKVHAMAQGGQLDEDVRVEENYLYSTRRFPNDTADNTIGGGAVTAGDYPFFTMGVNDPGNTAGYFSLKNLTYQQTNMSAAGKIPSGRGFKLYELAVSFNASALSADISQLLDTCSLAYKKQGATLTVQQGPIILWPGGVGISGYAGNSTTASTTTIKVEAASNGQASLLGTRRLKYPRVFNANDDVSYVVTAAANLPKTNAAVALSDFLEMRIWLFGYHFDTIAS